MAILTEHPGWKVLCNHQETIQKLHMRNLFESDPQRFDKFSLKLDDLLLDYSKHRITEETLDLLMQLAREAKIESWRDRMFSGEKINITEDRAVLHTALRNRSNTPVYVDDQDVMPDVNAVLAQMRVFSDKVRSGEWKGYTGKKITDVVNIGIGGSDLGPVMVCDALKPYANPELNIHFVSNIDGAHLVRALENILLPYRPMQKPSRNLVLMALICSSFGTGSADAIHCGQQLACQLLYMLAWVTLKSCSLEAMRWTITSEQHH